MPRSSSKAARVRPRSCASTSRRKPSLQPTERPIHVEDRPASSYPLLELVGPDGSNLGRHRRECSQSATARVETGPPPGLRAPGPKASAPAIRFTFPVKHRGDSVARRAKRLDQNRARSSTICLRAAPLGGPPTGAADRGDRDALSRLYGRQPPAVGPAAAHSAGRVPVAWAARVLLAAGRPGSSPRPLNGRARSPSVRGARPATRTAQQPRRRAASG